MSQNQSQQNMSESMTAYNRLAGFGQNNPLNKKAIALAYSPSDPAPKILASGKGMLADKIIEKAEENDIPIHKDEKLANTLSNLEIGEYIPPDLYEVVAEILVFVDSMDKIKSKVMR